MDWIKLFPADLESALNKPQLDVLKAESLRSLKRDIARDVLDSVVARIRAEISASGLNALDADHSKIPYELKESAMRLAVESLQLRLPSMELSAPQSKHADIARQTLLRIALGELPVSAPRTGVRSGSAKRGMAAKSARRTVSRENSGDL